MVDYSIDARNQLQSLIMRYCGYHTKGEYGISAFQNWYYQVINYVRSLDVVCEQECEYSVYEMPYWGQIVYSCHFIDDECMAYIHEFKFNKRNFNAWLRHQELKEQRLKQIVNEVISRFKQML